MRNIRGIDLDLLVTLEALLTDGNVTQVARRLHLSQPTVTWGSASCATCLPIRC
jgi:hypothetical protein